VREVEHGQAGNQTVPVFYVLYLIVK